MAEYEKPKIRIFRFNRVIRTSELIVPSEMNAAIQLNQYMYEVKSTNTTTTIKARDIIEFN